MTRSFPVVVTVAITGLSMLSIGAILSAQDADSTPHPDLPGDAPALPVEVSELTGKYEEAMSKAKVTLANLKKSFIGRLEKLKETTQAEGNLAGVVAIQKDMELLKAGKDPGKGSSFAPLAKLEAVFHEHSGISMERAYPECARIEEAYVGALGGLVAEYTKAGKLDEALAARGTLEASEERLAEWRRLANLGMTSGNPIEQFNWGKLGEQIKRGKISTTEFVGGGTEFRSRDPDIPEETALLVGFEVFFNPFGGSDKTVRGLIPIFLTESGKSFSGNARAGTTKGQGRRFVAKKGYVVGALTAQSERAVRKLKITFHRISGTGVDPSDAYDTGWLGEWETGNLATVTTEGKLPIGVDGFYGLGLDQLALIVVEP